MLTSGGDLIPTDPEGVRTGFESPKYSLAVEIREKYVEKWVPNHEIKGYSLMNLLRSTISRIFRRKSWVYHCKIGLKMMPRLCLDALETQNLSIQE